MISILHLFHEVKRRLQFHNQDDTSDRLIDRQMLYGQPRFWNVGWLLEIKVAVS